MNYNTSMFGTKKLLDRVALMLEPKDNVLSGCSVLFIKPEMHNIAHVHMYNVSKRTRYHRGLTPE